MKKSIIVTCLMALVLSVSATAQEERPFFTDKYGNHLSVQMNEKMGSAHRVYGELPNIRVFDFQRNELNQTSIKSLSSKFFSEYKDILNINPVQVKFRKADTDGHSWFVLYWQVVNDIPVYGTQIGYTVNQNGSVIALGADAYNNIEVSTKPKISNVEAQKIVSAEFASDSIEVLDSGSLFIYPKETDVTDFYLTWRVRLRSENPNTDKTYYVDATNGNVIEEFNNVTSHISYNIAGEEKEISLAGEVANANTNYANVQDENQEQSYHIYGTISGSYYPEHHYDTPVSTNFEIDGGIKIYNYAGQAIYWNINANNNGYYSATTSQPIYGLRVPVRNDWVRVRRFSNGTTSTVNSYYSISPSSTVERNVDFGASDASNVRYHVNKVHDYFKNTFGYSGMDYQMNAKIKEGPNVNGWSNGTNIGFGSQSGQEWALSSDVIYHEYAHNVTREIYDGFVGGGQSTHMDEGLSDYFSTTINNDAEQGESVGVNRDLDNSLSYDPSKDKWWNGKVIGGAAWDVREAVGATIADQLVFKAIQMSPKAHNMADFMQNMLDADISYYSGNHTDEIITAAENHGITAPLLPPPSTPTNVTITNPTSFGNPNIDWDDNPETDIDHYEVWRQKKRVSDGVIFPEALLASSTSSSYTDTNLFMDGMPNDYDWRYTVKAVNTDSAVSGLSSYTQWVNGISQHKQRPEITDATPEEFTLQQNYPNPFNPSTQVKFVLPEQANVTIQVYNITGQQVATLTNKTMQAGFHQVEFDGSGLSSGVYIARMQAVGTSGKAFTDELKMQLIK